MREPGVVLAAAKFEAGRAIGHTGHTAGVTLDRREDYNLYSGQRHILEKVTSVIDDSYWILA